MDSISWQVVEDVAGLLEKALTPDAKVKRNVRLPVIGKTRKRQCDVVITYGAPPRQTVSIVEVQKRARKPDINTFHGWYRKMQEVGAQHLICVSMHGYPKSIIDEVATRYGPTVRLLNLEELSEPAVPGLTFITPYILHKHPQFKLEEVGPSVRLEGFSEKESMSIEFNSTDKVFTLDDSEELQSISDVITPAMRDISSAFYQRQEEPPDKYSLDLTLGSVDKNLWLHISGQKYKVLKLPTKLGVETSVKNIPLTTFKYYQESLDGTLAWIAVAEGFSENKPVSVRLVFKKDEEGLLRKVSVYQKGVESVGLVVSSEKSAVEAYIQRSLQNSK